MARGLTRTGLEHLEPKGPIGLTKDVRDNGSLNTAGTEEAIKLMLNAINEDRDLKRQMIEALRTNAEQANYGLREVIYIRWLAVVGFTAWVASEYGVKDLIEAVIKGLP